MKLARFEAFINELKSEETLHSVSKKFNIYRTFENIWHDEDGKNVLKDDLSINLSKTLQTKNYWRERKSTSCYFKIIELDSVVVVEFNSPPKKEKQERLFKKIKKCYEHSKNAFDATHDTLTELYNKAGFEKVIKIIAEKCKKNLEGEYEISNEINLNPSVALISFDIDHFKQVNDTYGHTYGDVVLKCFARRLEKTTKALINEYENKLDLYPSRPGGEEFNVIAFGKFTDEEIRQIAERYRVSISEFTLPTDDEFREIKAEAFAVDMRLPHATERKITTSVGISIASSNKFISNIKSVSEQLLSESDIALYRAKAGGRNITIFYKDILQKHGRIIEHHKDTNIIAVDIGRQVNVSPGQEFFVFHPSFTGETPFIYTDGRTKKRLGYYPKRTCGRIEAFDVQSEISFCVINESDNNIIFPSGSVLEAIPLGTISYLFGDKKRSYLSPDGNSIEKAKQRINQIIETGSRPLSVVFKVYNSSEVINDKGIAYTNQALSMIYKYIIEIFPSTAVICVVKPANISIVIDDKKELNIVELISSTIEKINKDYAGQINFVAGIFSPLLYEKNKKAADRSELADKYSLEYAVYASTDEAIKEGNGYEIFSAETVSKIITKRISDKEYDKGIADYEDFEKLGIKYAALENQMAILYFSINNIELSIKHCKEAIALAPKEVWYHANLAFMTFLNNERENSYTHFSKCIELQPNFVLPTHYKIFYVLSKYTSYLNKIITLSRKDMLNELTSLLSEASSKNISKEYNGEIIASIAYLESTVEDE